MKFYKLSYVPLYLNSKVEECPASLVVPLSGTSGIIFTRTVKLKEVKME